MGKQKRKNKQATIRPLVGAALLQAMGGAAVTGVALVVREHVGELLGSVLLVLAVLGALYLAMWVGGAAMFVFFDQLSKNPERAVNWYWRLTWIIGLVSIPVASFLLEFDRDMWIWGTGSTVAGVLIMLGVLYGRPPKRT